ncbi:MAG TPA: histidine kinase [Bryobacteraceae bacterium]|nr:histidine kinase [Bryobacteraceae bacterium]
MKPATAKSPVPDSLSEMLLRQSPGCMWLLTPDCVFHSVYGNAVRVFGRPSAELEGTSFIGQLPAAARADWNSRIGRVFAGCTVLAAGCLHDDASPWSVTLFPVESAQAGGVFAAGMAHEPAGRALLRRMMQTHDADRARISRLLHDRVGPQLSAAGLQLDLLSMDAAEAGSPIAGRTREIQDTLDTAMGFVRELSCELNPEAAERAGLYAALDGLAGSLRAGFPGNVRTLLDSTAQVAPASAGALYRIAQEAAANAARHSGCSAIEILLKSLRNGTALEVRDNGHGFEAVAGAAEGLGILAMQCHAEQAGIQLEIESAPGKGTVVRAVCRSAEKST